MAGSSFGDSQMRWGAPQRSISNANDLSSSEGEFAPPEIKAELARSFSLRIPRSDKSPLAENPPELSSLSPSTPKTPTSGRNLRRSISLKRILKGGDADFSAAGMSPSKLSPQDRLGSFSFAPSTVSPTASPQFAAKTPPSPIGSPGGVAVPSPAAAFYGSPAVKLQSPLSRRDGDSSQPSRLNTGGTARTLFERRAEKQNQGGSAEVGEEKEVESSSAPSGDISELRPEETVRTSGGEAERPAQGGGGEITGETANSDGGGPLPVTDETQSATSAPVEEKSFSDVVNSTHEEIFRSMLETPPEQPSPSPSGAVDLGWGRDGSFALANDAAPAGALRTRPEPLTPESAASEPPWGETSSLENTPTPEKSAKPGHRRELSLSNSAPLMVTPLQGTNSDFPLTPGNMLVKRSNSTLEARALQRMKQDAFIQQLLRSSTVIGRDYTIKVDVSSAHLPGFSSFDLSDPGDDEDTSSVDTPSRLALTNYSESGHVIPPLTIAILIVGTRGDVQPFIAIGKKLLAYGHRVRLATHANYREFVTEQGLEFFPLGGDPKILAEYMVKNKGFLPSWPSEVKEQRRQLKSIIFSTWDACTSPDWESNGRNFIAEAIIANPPVYGHIHVAERLRIPLHVIFTMPWSPTGAFPHPLARLTQYAGFENRLSYAIVDSITWLGVRDIINSFRKKKLKLPPIPLTDRWSSSMLQTNRVPFAYIWSPSLVPKPKDWGSYIDVVGFCFLDLATEYKPPPELDTFLKEGPPPVFVGFGSLPVGDPQKMTAIIFEALRKTGMRGIVQKGWGGLGEGVPAPPTVHIVGNCPHDWLFPQCSAVVHHGGAGTTAAGLLSECPTTVVPFFGDQPFWGDAVFTQGVGPKAIPVGDFSLDRLVKALEFMARPEVKEAAVVLAAKMRQENGVDGAVRAFHKHLPKDIKTTGHKMLWGLTRKQAARAQPRQCGCFG